MARKQKDEISQAPETVPEPIVESIAAAAETCPTYTLHANSRFDIIALVQLWKFAHALGEPREKLNELEVAVRQFELYEERHRG